MEKTIEDELLTWASSANEKDRFLLLGKLLDCFENHELKDVQAKVKCAWKRKYRIQNSEISGPSSGPESLGPASDERPKEPVLPRGWWTKLKKSQIIAFDTEHVELLKPDEKTGQSKVLGEVAVVNFQEEIKYTAMVQHAPMTFHDNVIAGYRSRDGISGKPLQEVKKYIEDYFWGKFIVTCGGISDYSVLDLIPSNYQHFDLHQHFKKHNGQFTKTGAKVFHPIGLRSLYKHYFNEDIQSGSHSSEVDALATMKLFKKYIELKTTNLGDKNGTAEEFKAFKNIPILKKDFSALKNKFYYSY